MTLDHFLRKQFLDFIFVYKTLLKSTFGVTSLLSFLCLLFIATLHIYSGFSSDTSGAKMSLLSYLWYRYSAGDNYSLVDLSKSVLIFIMSFFSIAISRKILRDKENLNLKFGSFFDEMRPNDFGYLLIALVVCAIIDYLLFKLSAYASANVHNQTLSHWVYYQLHFLRIYLPLFIFSYTNRLALSKNKMGIPLKDCLFMLISIWLFNEFAYEISFFLRAHIFQLILVPIPIEKQFIAESMLAIPLVAFLFLGYHSAMTNSILILHNNAKYGAQHSIPPYSL